MTCPICPKCGLKSISENSYCERCFYDLIDEVQVVIEEAKL